MSGDPSLLDPFDHHIAVSIEGRLLSLPANNTLLRLLQFLGVDLYACRLCWNGDCDNCRFTFVDPGSGELRSAKGCQTILSDGLVVTRIPTDAIWPTDGPGCD